MVSVDSGVREDVVMRRERLVRELYRDCARLRRPVRKLFEAER